MPLKRSWPCASPASRWRSRVVRLRSSPVKRGRWQTAKRADGGAGPPTPTVPDVVQPSTRAAKPGKRQGEKKSRARRRGSSLGRKRPGRAEASATPHTLFLGCGAQSIKRKIDRHPQKGGRSSNYYKTSMRCLPRRNIEMDVALQHPPVYAHSGRSDSRALPRNRLQA